MEEKEDFYRELDRKTKHSFCTCQTMAIGLIILAIAVAAGLFIVGKKLTAAVLPQRQVAASRQDVANVQDRLLDLTKTPGASTTLTLTEKELTSLLVEAMSKNSSVPLRNIQAQINPDAIILNATSTQYLKADLAITVLPKVVEGKPKLELVKIQAGSLALPSQVTERIAASLENLLADHIAQLNGVMIKSILLGEGRMTITGTVKESTPSPS